MRLVDMCPFSRRPGLIRPTTFLQLRQIGVCSKRLDERKELLDVLGSEFRVGCVRVHGHAVSCQTRRCRSLMVWVDIR